jgi:hypothetical protein
MFRPFGSIPLKVVENGGLDWVVRVVAQIDRLSDPSEAPLLRASLLHGGDRSVIIYGANHTVADGLSLSLLLCDRLRTLGGETVVLSPVTASPSERCRSPGKTDTLPLRFTNGSDRRVER